MIREICSRPARALPILAALIGLAPSVAAQSPLLWLTTSSDIALNRDGLLVEPWLPVVEDGGAPTGLWPGPIPSTANLDALHEEDDGTILFSVDTWCELGGALIAPGDVVRWTGSMWTTVFNAGAAGLPADTNTDAVTLAGGDLLLSFDATVQIGAEVLDDEDLVRWNGAVLTMAIDGSAIGIAPPLDLDAAARLGNSHVLLSFDGSGEVDGLAFNDEDVLEYDPITDSWWLHHDLSEEIDVGWSTANLDALSVGEGAAPAAGAVRFAETAYWADEPSGRVRIEVARVDGRSGAISVMWSTSDGSATAPADYRASSGQLTWASGDTSKKTITLDLIDDVLVEGDETLSVELSSPGGGAVLGAVPVAVATITDDDTADLVVDDLGDAGDVDPGDGLCQASPPGCTLRAAIEEANALTRPNTIGFAVTGTITVGAPLVIADTVQIIGPGADQLAISGGDTTRIFELNAEDRDQITLSGLTLRNGLATDNGGAIRLDRGALDLIHCDLVDNTAPFGVGGALSVSELISLGEERSIRLRNCHLTRNSADLGGAVAARGHHWRIEINQCTIDDNTAQTSGGAIWIESTSTADPVHLELVRTGIIGNRATDGAGAGLDVSGAEVGLTSCTLSDNRARNGSSGALLATDSSTVVLASCTVAENTAVTVGGIACGPASTCLLRNSILTANTASNCGGSVASDGSNLDDDGSCMLNGSGDLSVVEPLLGPLVEHLGAWLHVPLPYSPAVDSTRPEACTTADGSTLTRDQRGRLRPADGNDDSVVQCDRGAAERGLLQGDLDLDGSRNAGDLADLISKLADPTYATHGSGDCTDDGAITTADLACLATVIAMR